MRPGSRPPPILVRTISCHRRHNSANAAIETAVLRETPRSPSYVRLAALALDAPGAGADVLAYVRIDQVDLDPVIAALTLARAEARKADAR